MKTAKLIVALFVAVVIQASATVGAGDPTRCPDCHEAGLTRVDSTRKMIFVTVLPTTTLVDADGNHHEHDPNYTTTAYSCDRGHEWTYSTIRECWCGWPRS